MHARSVGGYGGVVRLCRKSLARRFLLPVYAAVLLESASALIIYDQPNSGNTTAPPAPYDDVPWEEIGHIRTQADVPNATAIYLGNNMMLTADHVNLNLHNSTNKVHINGQDYAIDNSYTPTQVATGVDLKVFRITAGPLSSSVVLNDDAVSDLLNLSPSVIVGWGFGKGTEVVGKGWNWANNTTADQRWGLNAVSAFGTTSYGSYSYDSLNTDFDAVADQAAVVQGDSGGAMFQFISGQWVLVGVAATVSRNGASYYDAQNPVGSPAEPDWNYFVRISSYEDDIQSLAVPEPAAASLMAIAAVLFFGARRRR